MEYAGKGPCHEADWAGSRSLRKVDEAAWKALVEDTAKEIGDLLSAIEGGLADWNDEGFMMGILASVAHGAWHLGAIRQGLGPVVSPRRKA